MVEVGSGTSATYGVILLTIMAETLTRLDMSLSLGQLRFLQVLLLVGPTTSCLAGYHWVKHSEESNKTAESLIVLAFFSHSMYLALMTHFCRIRPQDNGAMLPTAFRSVLYLDVFGWLKLPQNEGMQYELSVPGSVRSRSEAPSPVARATTPTTTRAWAETGAPSRGPWLHSKARARAGRGQLWQP